MNDKIPLRQLAEEISSETGVSVDRANAFIKATFEIIGNRLLDGEAVSLPGIGRFLPMQDPENPVVFDPDVKFAEELNAPFSMFEPAEVDSAISAAQLKEIDEEFIEKTAPVVTEEAAVPDEPPAAEKENAQPAEDTAATDGDDEKVSCVAVESPDTAVSAGECHTATREIPARQEAQPEPETEKATETETAAEPEADAEPETEVETEAEPAAAIAPTCIPEDEEEFVEYHRPRSRFGIGFLVGLLTGLLIGAIALAAYAVYFSGSATPLF